MAHTTTSIFVALLFLSLQTCWCDTIDDLNLAPIFSPIFGNFMFISSWLIFILFSSVYSDDACFEVLYIHGLFTNVWWLCEFECVCLLWFCVDNVCKAVECGKGSCKASQNSTFFFSCECEPGWKQSFSDDDGDFRFLPCIIPNCKSLSLSLRFEFRLFMFASVSLYPCICWLDDQIWELLGSRIGMFVEFIGRVL